MDADIANDIAAYALAKSGGEINSGAQLANALGLDTLERTPQERFLIFVLQLMALHHPVILKH